MKLLRVAFGFLTIIPVGDVEVERGELGRSGAWFSVVGLVLGAMLAAAFVALGHAFSPLLAAALLVALWAALTGGLHLDGLADCCDGLLASAEPQRRLEIMRDPRTGAFAVIGLVLFLIVKVLAVAELFAANPQLERVPMPRAVFALLFAPAFARWAMLWVAGQPLARSGGLAAQFAAGMSAATFAIAGIVPFAMIACDPLRASIAAGAGVFIVVHVVMVARQRLGGITGDVIGLAVEAVELSILLVYASKLPL